MTFNIRGAFFTNDGANAWPGRADLNVATIRRYAPDLIGFQELQHGNLETYRADMSEYDYFLGPQYNDEEPFAYPAIFWNRERFELLDSGGFWLSTTPDRHSRAWETACIRSAAWVRLRTVPGGVELIHLNTHLDHVSEQARVEGARLIARETRCIAHDGTPLIVTGDFNCDPQSAAYQVFLEHGFTDTFIAAGGQDTAEAYTFHAFHGRRLEGIGRIDWILTRAASGSMRTGACFIVYDQQPPLYPSDHFPVVADLSLTG